MLPSNILAHIPPQIQNRIDAILAPLTPPQRLLLRLTTASVTLILLPSTIRIVSTLLLRVIGTALGVGLGLGLAAHVHDALDRMAGGHSRAESSLSSSSPLSRDRRGGGGAHASANSAGIRSPQSVHSYSHHSYSHHHPDQLDDAGSYGALMAEAGYDVPPGLLRGQILRSTNVGVGAASANTSAATTTSASSSATIRSAAGTAAATTTAAARQPLPITPATILENTIQSGPLKHHIPNPLYPHSVSTYAFTNFIAPPSQRGPTILRKLYPTLPKVVTRELGIFVDYIMRDFVNSWYSTIDGAVLYEDERDRRDRMERERVVREKRMVEEERLRRTEEILRVGRRAISVGGAAAVSGGGSGGDDGDEEDEEGGTSLTTGTGRAVSMPTPTSMSMPTSPAAAAAAAAAETSQTPPNPQQPPTTKHSTMVLTTSPLRPSPFPEALYVTLTTVIGNFAIHARNNVNVMELLLVKFVRVLSWNIRSYRELRGVAVEKRRRRLAYARGAARGLRKDGRQSSSSSGGAGAAGGGAAKVSEETAGATAGSSADDAIDERQSRRRLRSRRSGRSLSSSAAAAADNNGAESDGAHDAVVTSSSSGDHLTELAGGDDGPQDGALHPLPSESEVTEIAMIREYLLAGKLHRAITFGVDVPSLLFADPQGRDCPLPEDDDQEEEEEEGEDSGVGEVGGEQHSEKRDPFSVEEGNNDSATSATTILEEDAVLEARLFSPKSQILYESELDYCRVLSYRLLKETTSKADFASPVLRSMAVEMLASCVLAPVMACFSPDYINYGLKVGLESYAAEGVDETPSASTSLGATEQLTNEEDKDGSLMRGWDEARSDSGVFDEDEDEDEMDQNISDSDSAEEPSDLVSSKAVDTDEPFADSATLVEGPESEGAMTAVDGGARNLLPLLTMAIIDLQAHVDFDEYKRAQKHNEEFVVNWDDASCRAAVRRLVLVVEAALLHGLHLRARRKTTVRSSVESSVAIGTDEERFDPELTDDLTAEEVEVAGEQEEEKPEDAAHLKPTTLTVLLMEMTSDLDAFERRASEEECGEVSSDQVDLEGNERTLDSLPSLPPSEVSTLRTLIAAWMHTGQLFRTLSVLIKSKITILEPFYHPKAFVRDTESASDFVRQLRVLDGVDVLVDTTSVLRCSSLDMSSALLADDDMLFSASLENESVANGSKGGSSPIQESRPNHHDSGHHPQSLGESLVGGVKANIASNRQRLSRLVGADSAVSSSQLVTGMDASPSTLPSPSSSSSSVTNAAALHVRQQQSTVTPPHLIFSRNSAFASSLRLERERRMQSWEKVSEAVNKGSPDGARSGVDMICHTRGITEKDILIHRELHQLARAFYSGTVVLSIKRREEEASIDTEQTEDIIGIENVTSRRRFEVPDDDSSFLLRAQARPLNPVGVHRDQRNHEQSFKCFVATYEEPILHPKSKRYRGGRYLRRCLLRYYPSDRTATVTPMDESRHLDQRDTQQESSAANEVGSSNSVPVKGRSHRGSASSSSFLPLDFQKQRHPCNKQAQVVAGSSLAGSILTSALMEPADFSSVPRTGRALDFIFRMSLFEKPVVSLSGKEFTVQDSTVMGPHRADASALEISDASLSYAFLTLDGKAGASSELEIPVSLEKKAGDSGDTAPPSVLLADKEKDENKNEESAGSIVIQRDANNDSTMVWMKVNTRRSPSSRRDASEQEKGTIFMKPLRPSFLRAALLATSARQEAQLQCLLSCVRSGSARNATKSRTEALLQPCLSLLEFAVSKKREKQSILLRDLRFGINHIDSNQLRRNRILHPRYPTVLQSFSTKVATGIRAKQSGDVLGASSVVLYKINCVAIVELMDLDDDGMTTLHSPSNGAAKRQFFREEWTVLRSFREFLVLHKYLKNQVSPNESSGSAGAKIVGAATAALTFGESNQRQRRALIPSLGQASKAGALGVTQKSIERRRGILNDYLSYLTDPNHALNRCPEVLRFLGACDALPSEIVPEEGPDSLGRIDMKRTPLSEETVPDQIATIAGMSQRNTFQATISHNDAQRGPNSRGNDERRRNPTRQIPPGSNGQDVAGRKKGEKGTGSLHRARWASIKSQVEAVKLSSVRNGIFQFIRYQFDLDNASFFRSRIVSALKTMSFAVTSAQEFHKMLFQMHLQYVSCEAMAGWIKFGRDIIWPEGAFFEPSPDITKEEQEAQAAEALKLLMAAFPEQMRTLLGQEIARDGLVVFHEMLQNRVVLRSMSYMLMDEVWLSIFPDLRDCVTGADALEE